MDGEEIENNLKIASSYVHYLSHIDDINLVEDKSKKDMIEFQKYNLDGLSKISGFDVKQKLKKLEYLLKEKTIELKNKERERKNLISDKLNKEKDRKDLEILYNKLNLKYESKVKYTQGARRAYLKILHFLDSLYLLKQVKGTEMQSILPAMLAPEVDKLSKAYTEVKKLDKKMNASKILRLLEEAGEQEAPPTDEYAELLNIFSGKDKDTEAEQKTYDSVEIFDKVKEISPAELYKNEIYDKLIKKNPYKYFINRLSKVPPEIKMTVEQADGGGYVVKFLYDYIMSSEVLNFNDEMRKKTSRITNGYTSPIITEHFFGDISENTTIEQKSKLLNYLFELYTVKDIDAKIEDIRNIDVTDVDIDKLKNKFKWAKTSSPYIWLFEDKTYHEYINTRNPMSADKKEFENKAKEYLTLIKSLTEHVYQNKDELKLRIDKLNKIKERYSQNRTTILEELNTESDKLFANDYIDDRTFVKLWEKLPLDLKDPVEIWKNHVKYLPKSINNHNFIAIPGSEEGPDEDSGDLSLRERKLKKKIKKTTEIKKYVNVEKLINFVSKQHDQLEFNPDPDIEEIKDNLYTIYEHINDKYAWLYHIILHFIDRKIYDYQLNKKYNFITELETEPNFKNAKKFTKDDSLGLLHNLSRDRLTMVQEQSGRDRKQDNERAQKIRTGNQISLDEALLNLRKVITTTSPSLIIEINKYLNSENTLNKKYYNELLTWLIHQWEHANNTTMEYNRGKEAKETINNKISKLTISEKETADHEEKKKIQEEIEDLETALRTIDITEGAEDAEKKLIIIEKLMQFLTTNNEIRKFKNRELSKAQTDDIIQKLEQAAKGAEALQPKFGENLVKSNKKKGILFTIIVLIIYCLCRTYGSK